MLATKQKSPNTVKDQDVHPDPETQMPGVPSELPRDLSKHRLDIVRDCADLEGLFPDNVELDFIFWTHGDEDDPPSTTDIRYIARQLKGVDAVGVEVAEVGTGVLADGESAKAFTEKVFGLANLVFRDSASDDELNQYMRTSGAASSLTLTDFHDELIQAGLAANEMPEFFPVDTYAEVEPNDEPSLLINYMDHPSDKTLFPWVTNKRHREATVLRQIQERATILASDKGNHRVAILMGSTHSLVSVAAKALGAPTKRTLLDNPVAHVQEIIERV